MIRRSVPASPWSKRRTAALAAGALLAGAPLLAACGTSHAGAAAVIGDQQITISALQDKVKVVRDAQAKLDNADQVMERGGNLSNAALYSLVLERVVERAAKDANVTISRSELQRFRRAQEAAHGGAPALRQILLQQQAVAPSDIDSFFRTELAVQKLARKHSADLMTPQGQQQVGELLAKTSSELGVDINPRYGKWDNDQLTIGKSQDRWLRMSPGGQA